MEKLINKVFEDATPQQLDEFVKLQSELICARNSGDMARTQIMEFICEFLEHEFSKVFDGFEFEAWERNMHVFHTDDDSFTLEKTLNFNDCGEWTLGFLDALKKKDSDSIRCYFSEMFSA